MTKLQKIPMAHDVFLLRHGETEWNNAGRIQGQLNSPLTALGQDQARRQAQLLQPIRSALGAHRLWTSHLGRAQQTAQLAFAGDPFTTDPRLAEIDCGRWEGTTDADRQKADPDIIASLNSEFDLYAMSPEGEGTEKLASRLAAFLTELDAPAVIVSHKIALVVLRGLLTGDDNPLDCRFVPPQGSILQISAGVATSHT